MGVAATARDVAEFLVDRGVRTNPSLAITGHCAIPRELTLLRPDTVSNLRPVGHKAVSRRASVRRGVAALACVSAVGLGALGANSLRVRSEMPSSPAALSLADDVPTATRSESEGLPPAVDPAVTAPASESSGTRAARPHPKARPAHPPRSKAGTSHERSHAAP
jgi:hypothetical protein